VLQVTFGSFIRFNFWCIDVHLSYIRYILWDVYIELAEWLIVKPLWWFHFVNKIKWVVTGTSQGERRQRTKWLWTKPLHDGEKEENGWENKMKKKKTMLEKRKMKKWKRRRIWQTDMFDLGGLKKKGRR
jgi:hypothetical protein